MLVGSFGDAPDIPPAEEPGILLQQLNRERKKGHLNRSEGTLSLTIIQFE